MEMARAKNRRLVGGQRHANAQLLWQREESRERTRDKPKRQKQEAY